MDSDTAPQGADHVLSPGQFRRLVFAASIGLLLLVFGGAGTCRIGPRVHYPHTSIKVATLAWCTNPPDLTTCRLLPFKWKAAVASSGHLHWDNDGADPADRYFHLHGYQAGVMFINWEELDPPFSMASAVVVRMNIAKNQQATWLHPWGELPMSILGGCPSLAGVQYYGYRLDCWTWTGSDGVDLGPYGGMGDLSAGIMPLPPPPGSDGSWFDPDMFITDGINIGAGVNSGSWRIP